MKMIILAAGKGTRLDKYTENLPKGMLPFGDKSLIQRQIETAQSVGIDDITIVTGYQAEKIRFNNIKYYHNKDFASSNMVESLYCAREEMTDDVIISYADIIYEPRVLKEIKENTEPTVVAVDDEWKNYWLARYGRINCDLETLSINDDGDITELGSDCCSPDDIDSRYVGILKFSKSMINTSMDIYSELKNNHGDDTIPRYTRSARNLYMTDLLMELINSRHKVKAHNISKGWLEFDTNEDYERMLNLSKNSNLQELIKLKI